MGLVVKSDNTAAETVSRDVLAWLEHKGVACRRLPEHDLCPAVVRDTDFLLILGGDGTMVSVARQTMGMGIPLAGVNFGRVGFLAELSEHDWRSALENALSSGITVDSRLALEYTLLRGGAEVQRGRVANDVVVTRGRVARLVHLVLSINGEPYISLRSDGLILSTPIGSTGYAGSAGGPLLMPTVNSYVVAAICPYLSSFPPLVLTPETVFSIEIGEAAPDLYLTLDGQEAYPLEEGDRLDVRGEPGSILMADFGVQGYFERLCQAGFVHEPRSRFIL